MYHMTTTAFCSEDKIGVWNSTALVDKGPLIDYTEDNFKPS